MKKVRILTASALLCWASTAAAIAFEPMAATITVSAGPLYDYVKIGEDPRATDGYDNAFDTISPGNLNQDMGQPYLKTVLVHPQWKPALRELRGDIRPPAKRNEWRMAVSSSLARGTTLQVKLQPHPPLPGEMKVTLRDRAKEVDLAKGEYLLAAPGPGAVTELLILVEQK